MTKASSSSKNNKAKKYYCEVYDDLSSNDDEDDDDDGEICDFKTCYNYICECVDFIKKALSSDTKSQSKTNIKKSKKPKKKKKKSPGRKHNNESDSVSSEVQSNESVSDESECERNIETTESDTGESESENVDSPTGLTYRLSEDQFLEFNDSSHCNKPLDHRLRIECFKKYHKFISRPLRDEDSLTIVPGIGNTYAERLGQYINSVFELVVASRIMRKKNFKSLIRRYANVDTYHAEMIYEACRKYYDLYYSFINLDDCKRKRKPKRRNI